MNSSWWTIDELAAAEEVARGYWVCSWQGPGRNRIDRQRCVGLRHLYVPALPSGALSSGFPLAAQLRCPRAGLVCEQCIPSICRSTPIALVLGRDDPPFPRSISNLVRSLPVPPPRVVQAVALARCALKSRCSTSPWCRLRAPLLLALAGVSVYLGNALVDRWITA